MNIKAMICAVFGHRMKWANGGQDGLRGAMDCTRCGLHEPAVQCPPAPPMPPVAIARLPAVDRIQSLTITPGDTVVIQSHKVLTMEERDAMRDRLRGVFMNGVKALVLEPGMTLSVVTARPAVPVIPQPD